MDLQRAISHQPSNGRSTVGMYGDRKGSVSSSNVPRASHPKLVLLSRGLVVVDVEQPVRLRQLRRHPPKQLDHRHELMVAESVRDQHRLPVTGLLHIEQRE